MKKTRGPKFTWSRFCFWDLQTVSNLCGLCSSHSGLVIVTPFTSTPYVRNKIENDKRKKEVLKVQSRE